jgi:hypothetical protein
MRLKTRQHCWIGSQVLWPSNRLQLAKEFRIRCGLAPRLRRDERNDNARDQHNEYQ